jgi:hypothetical protein
MGIGLGRRLDTKTVMAGLDPAIHRLRPILRRLMDARVKPAHDVAINASDSGSTHYFYTVKISLDGAEFRAYPYLYDVKI